MTTQEFFLDRLRLDGDVGVIDAAAHVLIDRFGVADRVRRVLLDRGARDSVASCRAHAILRAETLFSGHPEVKAALIERVQGDDSVEVRARAVQGLARTLADQPADVPVLIRAARRDEDALVRLAAVRALVAHAGLARRVRRTLEFLIDRDPDVEVRMLAVAGIAPRASRDVGVQDRLVDRASHDPDARVRASVARALAEQAPDWQGIGQLLLDRIGQERDVEAFAGIGAAAAALVAKVGAERLQDALGRRLRSAADPRIRHAALRLLVSAVPTDSTQELLLERLAEDTDATVVIEATTLAASVVAADHRLLTLLVARATDPNPTVRSAAIHVLAERFGDDVPARALALAAAQDDVDPLVRKEATRAVAGRLAMHDDVRRVLIERLRDSDTQIRQVCLRALCEVAAQDRDIRALVVELAASAPDRTLRQIACQALTWLPGASPDQLPDIEPDQAAIPVVDPPLGRVEAMPEYRLERVFLQTGTPTHTFVEPPDYALLQMALRQPGLGVVIEGPSGIGKTTLIRRCLDEARSHGHEVEELSGRTESHYVRLAALLAGDHHGIVAIDDFHRVPGGLRERLADYLKSLADEGAEDRRLIIIGIPETGRNLIRFGHDLATRVRIFRIPKVGDNLVLRMIRQGEQALNVTLTHAEEVVRVAAGSLNVAQMLCLHMAFLSSVEKTVERPVVIDEGIERALAYVDNMLSSTYQEVVQAFCALDGDKRRTCIDLLMHLATTEGALSLDDVQKRYPALSRDIRTCILDAFPTGFDGDVGRVLKDHLFLDVQSRQLVVENPLFLFYLRQRRRDSLIAASGKRELMSRSQIFISYSHTDLDWLSRLRQHLVPLEEREYIDVWADTNLNPGDLWRDEIEAALDRARVAILVVTSAFLRSDFITKVELPKLLAAARSDGCRIWPLIVAPSVFSQIPDLAQFQAFNPPSMPLTGMNNHEQEDILSRLAIETLKHFPPAS